MKRIQLPEFRQKIEDCLEARGAKDETLTRATEMLLWAEKVHRCGLSYLAKSENAFKHLRQEKVRPLTEQGNATFFDAGGQSLAVAGPLALEKAIATAKQSGVGLAVISNTEDYLGIGQLVEDALERGYACFGTFASTLGSLECQILTEIYGNCRSLMAVGEAEKAVRVELYGLSKSHERYMKGNAPAQIGELLVNALSEATSLTPGATLLCLDLPDVYDNIKAGLEAGVEEAPARLFYAVELEVRNLEIAEDGFQVDEEAWNKLQDHDELLPPPPDSAEV